MLPRALPARVRRATGSSPVPPHHRCRPTSGGRERNCATSRGGFFSEAPIRVAFSLSSSEGFDANLSPRECSPSSPRSQRFGSTL